VTNDREATIGEAIPKCERTTLRTHLSSLLFLVALVAGAAMNIPLTIMGPVVVTAAILLVLLVGLPTQRRWRTFKHQLQSVSTEP